MGRGSREEKQQKRAREELATALRRGDVERAVGALLAQPMAERERDLPAVARLFRAAATRARRDGDWARLDFWAARAEREPGLVAAGATPEEEAEVRWALFWSAVRGRQWERARAHWPAFAGRLPERLRDALLAFVDDEGAPAPELLRPFVTAETDPRLGYGRRTPQRPAPAAPVSAEQVEPAVLALAGVRGVREFVATIERWAETAPAPSAAILALAVRLLPGPILERAGKDGAGGEALESAAALARFVRWLGIPGELTGELGLALRIAGAAAHASPDGLDRARASGVLSVACVAARVPSLRKAALALAVATPYLAEARGVVLEALEELGEGPDTHAVPLKALGVWSLERVTAGRPPDFVSRGIAVLLDVPGALAEALAALAVPTRKGVFEAVPRALPLELAERFLDEAWSCEELVPREAWLDALDALLIEARASEVRGQSLEKIEQAMVTEAVLETGVFPGPDALAELHRYLHSPEGRRFAKQLEALDADDEGRPLPPVGRRIWGRFAQRALPFALPYLELALEQGARKPERVRLVSIYLGAERRGVGEVVRALAGAEEGQLPRATKALVEYLVEGTKGNREVAAQALVYARRRALRRGICGPLARAFEAEDARLGEAPDDPPAVRDARLELRLLGRRVKPPAPRTRAGTRRPAPKPRGEARARPEQVSLPFGGKEKHP